MPTTGSSSSGEPGYARSCRASVCAASVSIPIPPMRDAVPVKCRSTSSGASPTASKICAPQYELIVEMPILDIVLSRPLAIPFTARCWASSPVISFGSRPWSTRSASVSSIRYGLTAAAP